MIEVPERSAIVSGIGISRVGRKTGIPGPELTEESCRAAIADAGLTPADIDGMATMGDTPLADAAAALGIEASWTGGDTFHGGLISPIFSACLAVASGEVRHVLIYRTVQMMGGTLMAAAGGGNGGGGGGPSEQMARGSVGLMGDLMFQLTFHAYSAANWLAMHCRRHMHLYGTTKEQLGWLAVSSRRYAGLNDRAAYRDPITLDDYLAARPISDPFGLLDCDVPVDGSIALVISTAGHADDCPNPPVRINAFGGFSGSGSWDQRPDYPKMASVDAAAELWSRTDLTPADVDVAQLYDGFTFIAFAWLEALGFCADGEAGPFVEGGTRIALDGQLPLNTYGGQLSAGRMHGYWYLHEACLQVRGQAGARQVPRHEVAVAAVGGGPFAGCVLLTR